MIEKYDDVELSISIVSHKQGAMVAELLHDIIEKVRISHEIILTLNVCEDEYFIQKFINNPNISVIRNISPKGFGSNHNAAFECAKGKYFAVLNPDIRLSENPFPELYKLFLREDCAICAPAVFSSRGNLEDNAREFPDLFTLVRRTFDRVWGRQVHFVYDKNSITSVDWIAGMFMLFRHESFRAVGGFNERYHLYFEDVEICRRLSRLGWKIYYCRNVSVIHNAQRASRKKVKYFYWHFKSMTRFLFTNKQK